MHPKPFIDFIITQNCNFRCEYCSQSKRNAKDLPDASDEVIEGFFCALKDVPRDFEITITGGEPLLHPRFFEIISRLKNMDFKVAIVSNFSSSAQKYKQIIDILDDSLSFLMLSLHSESISNLDDYIHKALIVKSYTHPKTKMRVCAPLWRDNLPKLKYIQKKLNNTGIEFEPQHIRINNRFYNYNDEQKHYLEENNAAVNKNIVTFGRYCAAGKMSAVIYENGEIYRCYSSRLIKSHKMGNIKSGSINFDKCEQICSLPKCTCPKPMNYNMFLNKRNYFSAIVKGLCDLIHLPGEIRNKNQKK